MCMLAKTKKKIKKQSKMKIMKVGTEKCRNGRIMVLFDVLHMPNASFDPKLLEDDGHTKSLSL